VAHFFTVNLLDRRSDLLVARIDALREAVRRVRDRAPFHIDAWAVLPDHMHCVWTLPDGDCRLSGSLAGHQNRVFEILARRRTAVVGHCPPRRTWHLAATVLGAYDPRRSRLCGAFGLHAFQPGKARPRAASGRLAAFVVSSMRRQWALSQRMARRHQRAARDGRAAVRPR
jgi:hypothetical protein